MHSVTSVRAAAASTEWLFAPFLRMRRRWSASHRLTVRQLGIALGGGFEYVGGGAWRPHQTQAQPPTPKANNRRTRTPATEAAVLVVRLTAHSVAKQAADD